MVEMNEEFKEYYESLNGAIYRMVSSNNQGNNSGYFQVIYKKMGIFNLKKPRENCQKKLYA